MQPHYLTPDEAVSYIFRTYNIRYSSRYFAKLRCTSGDGPRFVTHSRRIYYLTCDLDEWIKQRTHVYRTTAERSAAIARAKAARTKEPVKIARGPSDRDLDIFQLLAGLPG